MAAGGIQVMSFWGKIIGSMAGFAMGGPFGAVVGAALGHAADTGAGMQVRFGELPFSAARMAALLGRRDQLFAIATVVLAAKLAKCDAPVNRAEIDAFKGQFRIPPQAARDIGRLFDQARDTPDGFEDYADQLGETFADSPGMLEDVISALFAIARADGQVNGREIDFLARVHRGFRLNAQAWERARGGAPRQTYSDGTDCYAVLGVAHDASDEAVRTAWKQLVRENHPDGLAARGVSAEFIARANEKVARINAAWDRIKRERGL
jgi:DnaJ like chaperone protein